MAEPSLLLLDKALLSGLSRHACRGQQGYVGCTPQPLGNEVRQLLLRRAPLQLQRIRARLLPGPHRYAGLSPADVQTQAAWSCLNAPVMWQGPSEEVWHGVHALTHCCLGGLPYRLALDNWLLFRRCLLIITGHLRYVLIELNTNVASRH